MSHSSPLCFSRARRGIVLLYAMVAFIVLCGVVSLAVDYGRVSLIKSELQFAADAAACAAIGQLGNGTAAAQTSVVQLAAANLAEGQPVVLVPSTDVEFGTWDSGARAFTVLTGSAASSANAVRVTARRTSATGNAPRLYFAALLGRSSFDVTGHSIALASGSGGYIGISLTRMYNTSHFDGYYPSGGPYSSSASVPGNLLSFKDMWLYDTASVKGEAHWDVTGTFNRDATAVVSPGPKTAEDLSTHYPPVDLGSVATANNNTRLTQYYVSNQLVIPDNIGTVTFPGGTYYFTKFDIGKGNSVFFSGPATLYLNCSGMIQSTIASSDYRPAKLSIKVAPATSGYGPGPTGYNWSIDASGNFYGSFYNPTGDVHHHNGGISHGSVISDLLCFRQNSEGHQDMTLGKYARASAGAQLVK